MKKRRVSLDLPEWLREKVKILAIKQDISMIQWITNAIIEKIQKKQDEEEELR